VVGDLVQAPPPKLCDFPLRTIALRPRSSPVSDTDFLTLISPTTPGCGHDASCMWNNENNSQAISGLLQSNNAQPCPTPKVLFGGGYTPPSLIPFPGFNLIIICGKAGEENTTVCVTFIVPKA